MGNKKATKQKKATTKQRQRKYLVVSPTTYGRLRTLANRVALRKQTRATMELGIKEMLDAADGERLVEMAPASEQ